MLCSFCRFPYPVRSPMHPLALATLLALAGAVQAQSAVETTHLPPVTVTATLSEHDARTAPASVTVITNEELAQRNATDLLDAVRAAPGISLDARQVGGRKTITLRGMGGKHVLTLVNGRRVNASDDVIGHSDYQYGWIPMSSIERIEVIRGPMSALYGSEALGGVINIITKQPKDHWTGALGARGYFGGGKHAADEGGLTATVAGPLTERLRLTFNAEYAHRDAVAQREDPRHSEIEGRKPRTLGLDIQWELAAGHTLEAGITDGEERRFYDSVSGTQPYANRYDLERRQSHIGWKGEMGDWRAQVRAYRSEFSVRNSRTHGVRPTRPQDLQDDVLDGHLSTRWGGHQVTLGGEWRKEELINAGLENGRDDVTHKALFVQDEFALTGNLLATLGLRTDHHGIFGSEVSPRAYLVWEASPALVLKTGFGHAFKAPTLKQISPSYVASEGPHTFLGNADVEPETSNSFEIGADWHINNTWSLRATAFHTQVKQLITTRQIDQVGPRRTYLYDNVDAARIQGLEAGFTWDILPALQWSVDTTLLHTRDKTTGERLSDRPNHRTTSRLAWRSGTWDAQLGTEYTGNQRSAGQRLPAYTLWNASVGTFWPWGSEQRLSLRAGVENLGNLRLAEKSPAFGYAEQGRRAFVVARVDF